MARMYHPTVKRLIMDDADVIPLPGATTPSCHIKTPMKRSLSQEEKKYYDWLLHSMFLLVRSSHPDRSKRLKLLRHMTARFAFCPPDEFADYQRTLGGLLRISE